MDVMVPPYLYPDEESVEVVDRTSTVFRPEFAAGIIQRQEQAAPILRVQQRYTSLSQSDRGTLLSFVRTARGRVNGIYLAPLRYQQRGSFPGTELLTNGTFANGTTGWAAFNAESSIASQDRILRSTVVVPGGENWVSSSAALTVTQYAPYVLRAMLRAGKTSGASTQYRLSLGPTNGSATYATEISSSLGLRSIAAVLPDTSVYTGVSVYTTGLSSAAYDYYDISYLSLARCALVDNESTRLQRSEDFNTSPWSQTRCTVTSDTGAVENPLGGGTADAIVEDGTASNTHFVSQIANLLANTTNLDYCFGVALKAGERTWACMTMTESVSSHIASLFVNLSTGALGTVGTSGANWSNTRAYVTNLGSGWWGVYLVAKKVSGSSTITCGIRLSTGDNGSVYSGDGASKIYAWRATLVQSSVPMRLTGSTSAVVTDTLQSGSALYSKGWPVSTSGVLLPGDLISINGELKQITAPLDTDAAGLGHLQFEPPLFRQPSDGTAIVVTQPFGKFLLSDNGKIVNRLGRYADLDLVFEELYE